MSKAILRRVYWRLLRTVGLERMSWDKQFAADVWCSGPRSEHTIRKVVELCKGGDLVEFGCGEGTLPVVLPRGSFSHYVGYDISGVAVQRAHERARAAGLSNCQFEQCDMAAWKGCAGVALVVAEECLYYLSPADAEAFLERCCNSLRDGGSILVIVHSAEKHRRTLDVCRRVCTVLDESVIGDRTFMTLTGAAVREPRAHLDMEVRI